MTQASARLQAPMHEPIAQHAARPADDFEVAVAADRNSYLLQLQLLSWQNPIKFGRNRHLNTLLLDGSSYDLLSSAAHTTELTSSFCQLMGISCISGKQSCA